MNAETAAQKFAAKSLFHASIKGNRVSVNQANTIEGMNFIFYDTVPPTVDEIRIIFKELPKFEYVCFVLSKDLVPKEGEEIRDRPEWMIALHALYFGQIFFYLDNGEITSFHLEKNVLDTTWTCQWNPYQIDPTMFRSSEHECYARGWDDQYRTVNFKSASWWKEHNSEFHESPKHHSERKQRRQKQQRSSTSGNPDEDFKRWQREYQADWSSGFGQKSVSKWTQSAELLGIKEPFTQEQLKAAYRKAAFRYHPDHCKEPGATEKMQQVNEAYSYLKT